MRQNSTLNTVKIECMESTVRSAASNCVLIRGVLLKDLIRLWVIEESDQLDGL